MGQLTSTPIKCSELTHSYSGSGKFVAVWNDLTKQNYVSLKHIKSLKPGPLDLFSNIGHYNNEQMRVLLHLMLHAHTNRDDEEGAATVISCTLREAIYQCVDAVLCHPTEDITGPIGMEYRANVDGSAIIADIDMVINTSHILQLTGGTTKREEATVDEQEVSNYLLHCAATRYLANKEQTTYITQLNIGTGALQCWKVQPNFYTLGRAARFVEESLAHYRELQH